MKQLSMFRTSDYGRVVPAEDTKRESFRQIREEEPDPRDVMALAPKLGDRQAAVYKKLLKHGPMHNRRLAELLGWPINAVTPRVKELRERGWSWRRGAHLMP